MKTMGLRLVLALLAVAVMAGCNLMEGLHQFSPEYRDPVPFSTPWWEKRREKKRVLEEKERLF
jgi:hypothetical protein